MHFSSFVIVIPGSLTNLLSVLAAIAIRTRLCGQSSYTNKGTNDPSYPSRRFGSWDPIFIESTIISKAVERDNRLTWTSQHRRGKAYSCEGLTSTGKPLTKRGSSKPQSSPRY